LNEILGIAEEPLIKRSAYVLLSAIPIRRDSRWPANGSAYYVITDQDERYRDYRVGDFRVGIPLLAEMASASTGDPPADPATVSLVASSFLRFVVGKTFLAERHSARAFHFPEPA